MEVIGKNGSNTLAATIAQILPKLEDAVILMYLSILANASLPSKTPSSSTFRSFFSRMTFALSRTASVAFSTEIPTSARITAGRSFRPSPRNPTVCPFVCSVSTSMAFCFGESSAKIFVFSTAMGNSFSERASSCAPVRQLSAGIPIRLQMDRATCF